MVKTNKGCGKNKCGKLKGYYPNGDTWYCEKCETLIEQIEQIKKDPEGFCPQCEEFIGETIKCDECTEYRELKT